MTVVPKYLHMVLKGRLLNLNFIIRISVSNITCAPFGFLYYFLFILGIFMNSGTLHHDTYQVKLFPNNPRFSMASQITKNYKNDDI